VFEYTPYYVKNFYSVSPIQIIDRKAIEGDSSDNIPGISGVGEKTVIPLLQEFETVEGIYDFIENSSEEEIKEMFKALGIS
jgi:DNA polymerase-1